MSDRHQTPDIGHQPSGIRRLTSDIRRLTSDFGHLTLDYSDQLVSQFLGWTNANGMPCNPSKYKELTIKKRGNRDLFSPVGMIPSCKEVEILGVTFHCDIKISVHAKNLLSRANKSLYVLRMLGKAGYNQSEIDLLFNTIVVPNINDDHLSTPRPFESDLTHVQYFLDRCFKRKYTSKPVSVYEFLERKDRKIFRKNSNN